MFIPRHILEERMLKMLSEDLGQGDVTTALVVPARATVEAHVVAKESGVVAGVEETAILLESLGLRVETLVGDGEQIKAKQVIAEISGNARALFSAERTFLNLLSRMSGIATTTRKLVERLRKSKLRTKVACTRKTAPGLLYFDKKAVLVGGGDTHRLHLDDMILIKDNHIALTGSIKEAIGRTRKDASFTKKIEVEVTKAEDALIAAKAGADIIMLDNFSPKQIEKACSLLAKHNARARILLEASGGINSENALEYAATGVDIISLGELTNSVRPLDISLEVVKTKV